MTGIEIFGQVVATVIYFIPVFLFSVTLIREVIQAVGRLIKKGEMTMRLIDAEALKESFYKKISKEELQYTQPFIHASLTLLEKFIDHAPTIEAKPIVHAHWISENEAEELGHLEWSYGCSNCKEIFWDCTESFAFSYCPHCGALMDEPFPQIHKNGVKIPVISMEDVPKIMKEMEK